MPGAAGALFPLPALPQTSCCPHPQWVGWVMPLPSNCTGWGVPSHCWPLQDLTTVFGRGGKSAWGWAE